MNEQQRKQIAGMVVPYIGTHGADLITAREIVDRVIVPLLEPPGRITIQLEPERITGLVGILKSAGAHPANLGSYAAANEAFALAEDVGNMAEPQGWRP